jgi:hypothetical protein
LVGHSAVCLLDRRGERVEEVQQRRDLVRDIRGRLDWLRVAFIGANPGSGL